MDTAERRGLLIRKLEDAMALRDGLPSQRVLAITGLQERGRLTQRSANWHFCIRAKGRLAAQVAWGPKPIIS